MNASDYDLNSVHGVVMSKYQTFLDSHRLQVIAHEYSPEQFGNSFVTLKSENIALVITVDRGPMIVEVGPDDDEDHLFELSLLLEYLKRLPSGPFPCRLDEMSRIIDLLDTNWQAIESAFLPDNYETTAEGLFRISKERMQINASSET